ncbi:hypothetical protein [Gracilimonas sp.]|uniref:hypothetical protein n=1 Tax=Gracilimonas sp. TaxID=1974203 RepID=UPI003D0E4D5D
MKSSKLWVAFLSLFLFVGLATQIQAQTETETTKTYLIIKNDGSRYVGQIISQDAREVILLTKELGEIAIPKHEIKEMRELTSEEITDDGRLRRENTFATRYYISTNANPISKGENYIIWNLYGPDIQFGISDDFGVGLMTTWFGSPIVGSAKYSLLKKNNVGVALGTLLGTGSWASPEYGIALPFGSVTLGEMEKNISLSVGYGAVFGPGSSGGSALFSLAGMNRISDRVSLVFDSFVVMENNEAAALIIPAVRLHSGPKKAFQLGFAGVAAEGELLPFPFPFLQWYRAL